MSLFNPFNYPSIFQPPTRLSQPPAWVEHIPFAHFLIEAIQPSLLVELGTHSGNSYCAFCQIIKQNNLDTRCFAVDTWEGDSQAGFYGPVVFEDLQSFHDPLYGDFSTLLRSTFDDALSQFENESIDILHVDGLHTYEAVKKDFENWLPKLNDRGIVLLHDTQVKRDGFGVWKLWDELKIRFPSFEFPHGNGLGVLAVGSKIPEGIDILFKSDDQKSLITTLFQQLGARYANELILQRINTQLDKSKQKEKDLAGNITEINEKAKGLFEQKKEIEGKARILFEQKNELGKKAKLLSQQIEASDKKILSLNNEIVNRDKQIQATSKQLEEQNRNIESLNSQLEEQIKHQDNLQDQINKQAESLKELNQQTQVLATQVSKKNNQITKLNNEVRQYRKTNQEIVSEVKSLQNSRTWKMFTAFHSLSLKIAPEGSFSRKVIFFLIKIITTPIFKITRRNRLKREIEILRNSELFDTKYYLQKNPDIAASSIDPYKHYLIFGANEGRNPSQAFNTNLYLLRYPDIQIAGINPLVHYLTHGKSENRTINPTVKAKKVGYKKDFKQTRYNAIDKNLIKLLLTNQRFQYPLTEAEHLAIGAMESIKNTLVKKYSGLPQEKKVSIILPTYNRAKIIMDAINSVLNQTYKNWELIVIDDNSNDDTCSIIKDLNHPKIKLIRNETNVGSAASRNNAFKHISGDYICYLDSDNQFNKDFLLVMVNELNRLKQYDILYCAMNLFNYDIEEKTTEKIGVRYSVFNRPTLENHNYIDMGAIMHRKKCIKKIKFNESMQRLADWSFLLQLTESKPAYSIPCILVDYFYNKAPNQNTNIKSYDKALEKIDAYLMASNEELQFKNKVVNTKNLFSSRTKIRHFQTKPVSIIIPSFNCLDYLDLCLQSVQRFSSHLTYELIIVDNGSAPKVRRYLKLKQREKNIQIIFNHENLGFTQAINQGIQQANPENDVILLNNDTLVTKNWIEAFQEVTVQYPQVGLVVPTQIVLPTEKTLQIHRPLSNKSREIDVNLSVYHNNVVDPNFDPIYGYIEVNFAPFFCVYIPRDTINNIGLLDNELGAHYYSDHFYCDSIRELLKRKIIYTPKAKIYHFIQQSTKEIRKSNSDISKNLMKKNW